MLSVTSVKRRGISTRSVLAGNSSAGLRAKKPVLIRSRSGVLCSCTSENRQWWLVTISPLAETNPPEQPPMRTVPDISPVPRSPSQSPDGGSCRPCSASHAGSMSSTWAGVHLPSRANADGAAMRATRSSSDRFMPASIGRSTTPTLINGTHVAPTLPTSFRRPACCVRTGPCATPGPSGRSWPTDGDARTRLPRTRTVGRPA